MLWIISKLKEPRCHKIVSVMSHIFNLILMFIVCSKVKLNTWNYDELWPCKIFYILQEKFWKECFLDWIRNENIEIFLINWQRFHQIRNTDPLIKIIKFNCQQIIWIFLGIFEKKNNSKHWWTVTRYRVTHKV